jgi:hypothetical protein
LPQYLSNLLRELGSRAGDDSLSPSERAAAWRESVKGLPRTPALSDDAISRESIYGDRGL